MQWLTIILLSVVACILYGIGHDLVTTRLCVEYFTVGHPPIFKTDDPILLSLGWGVTATWWVGVILGVPLAAAARVGARPKRDAASLCAPVAVLIACTGAIAALSGTLAYVAATSGWIKLVGPLANQVPVQRHVWFLVDLWTHNASYAGGFIGGAIVIGWVWRSRGRAGAMQKRGELQQQSGEPAAQ